MKSEDKADVIRVALGVLLMLGFFAVIAIGVTLSDRSPANKSQERCEEDLECWDARTMGDQREGFDLVLPDGTHYRVIVDYGAEVIEVKEVK